MPLRFAIPGAASRRLASAACGAALGALAWAAPAGAQGLPDRTGTGGGPDSTITAPFTNREGVTKPPGTSLGPGEVPSARTEQRERRANDRIENSICRGC